MIRTFALNRLPDGAVSHGVDSDPAMAGGREALRVTLDARTRAGTFGVDFADQPTFVVLPMSFSDGAIEVDLFARLRADAPDYARGFIGIAYRIAPGFDRFEAVYLRPTNGRKAAPPPPRDMRAVQYFAYPDWPFDRLRSEEPDGGFETGADIAPGEWITLRLDIAGSHLRACVNGVPVLELARTKQVPAAGAVGLWVDIGTEGHFANLRVSPV